MLYPCSICDRHLRDSEPFCPFCGAAQSTTEGPSLGAVALTVALLGSIACGRDPLPSNSTTTSMSSSETNSSETDTSSSTTITDTTDSNTTVMTVTDTDDTTTDTANTAGSFYAPPSDIGRISGCSIFAQDCPDGEKCVPYSTDGDTIDDHKCVPVLGDGQPGEPCLYGGIVEATDDCGADSFCFPQTDDGICVEFCDVMKQCPMGFECQVTIDELIGGCFYACDPLLQDCADGFTCQFLWSQMTCLPTTDNVALGDPCDTNGDCAVGLTCLFEQFLPNCAGLSCCTSFCDLAAPVCAQMGTECTPFFDGTAPMGQEDVGVCTTAP